MMVIEVSISDGLYDGICCDDSGDDIGCCVDNSGDDGDSSDHQ